jgi:hypothetical protein
MAERGEGESALRSRSERILPCSSAALTSAAICRCMKSSSINGEAFAAARGVSGACFSGLALKGDDGACALMGDGGRGTLAGDPVESWRNDVFGGLGGCGGSTGELDALMVLSADPSPAVLMELCLEPAPCDFRDPWLA